MQMQAPPTGFSGELMSYTADSVTLKDKDGKTTVVPMTKGWFVSTARTQNVNDIKPGAFVATANTVVNDTTGRSTELRIMEPGYRPEEGTHLMQANLAMTHGTVTNVTKTAEGAELDVAYPGGSRHLIVPATIKITGYDLRDIKQLQPGTKVGAVARKGDDGVLRAGRLNTQE